jgi:O-methyltransferase
MKEWNATSEYLDLLKRALTGTLYDESAWTVEGIGPGRYPRRKPLKFLAESVCAVRRFIATAGRRVPTVVVRCDPYDAAEMEPGRKWPMFGYTMIGLNRLGHIQSCVEDVLRKNVPGDLIEAGVWRGGATIFMRALLRCHQVQDRTVWVADSFEGLPPAKGVDAKITDDADLSREAYLKVSLPQVQANFARFGMLDGQVKFLKGWFEHTLPAAPIERLAVLRIDGDMYHSTLDVLNALYARVSPGGYVIIDDYPGWEGCRRATDEFRAAHGIQAELRRIDWTGVCWQIPF